MRRVEIKNAVMIYDPSRHRPLRHKLPKLRTPRMGTVYRVYPKRLDPRIPDD